MIDRDSRDRLALALRRFASGRITRNELDLVATVAEDSTDPGVAALVDAIYWQFLNMGPNRLLGRHALEPVARHGVARWVLFLRSEEPYAWPRRGPSLEDMVRAFFTLGQSWMERRAEWAQTGDESLWPFVGSQQLTRVAGRHPFVPHRDPSA